VLHKLVFYACSPGGNIGLVTVLLMSTVDFGSSEADSYLIDAEHVWYEADMMTTWVVCGDL